MASTLLFETFWNWLLSHPNCLLRAGTPEAVLYDDDDLHWQFGADEEGGLLVQLLRGKRIVGEIFLDPESVSYVEWTAGDREGEFFFDLVAEGERERVIAFQFTLSHGYEENPVPHGPRVH